MKILVNELKTILTTATSGLSANENIEQANRFIFKEGKLITFNDEMLVCVPFDIDLTGAVIAKECLSLLDKLQDSSEIKITEEENMLVFRTKHKNKITKAGLDFQKSITLPLEELDVLPSLKWKPLPGDFLEGLEKVYPSASRSEAFSVLQSVHIKDKYIEATDNFNLARFTMDKARLPEMCLYFESIKKLTQYPVYAFSVTPQWIFFKTKENIIVGLRNFGDIHYPSLDRFFESFEGKEIQLPENLSDSLSKASVFYSCTDTEQKMDFSIKNSYLILKIQNEAGFLEDKIKLKKTVPEFQMEVSLPQLTQLFKKSHTFELGASLSRIKDNKIQYISAVV